MVCNIVFEGYLVYCRRFRFKNETFAFRYEILYHIIYQCNNKTYFAIFVCVIKCYSQDTMSIQKNAVMNFRFISLNKL